MHRLVCLIASLFALVPAPASLSAPANLRHGIIWYSDAPDSATLDTALERYVVGITGKGGREDAQRVAIKQRKSEFAWYVYNSATDNYVTSVVGTPEHDLLLSVAAEHGFDPEEAYTHYWDDTIIVLQGDTLQIPGWGGGSAASPEEARVPVYYSNLSRRVTNFSTPQAATINREVIVRMAFDTPFDGSSTYPDGIFLDNSTAKLFNYGRVLSGGLIREAPGHPRIGSPKHQDWHWNVNYGPFLTSLKDTLEAGSNWSGDGQRKYLMINVANIWDDGYVSRDAADIIFQEFQYNAVRDFGVTMMDEARRRTTLAESAGITCFYPAITSTRSVAGRPDEYSYAEIMRTNLVWYLLARTSSTIFFEFGTPAPSAAGWDSLTWRGCLDTADDHFGQSLGEPYTLQKGKDPLGNSYVVNARAYEGGLVVLRNRGSWDEGIEPETAVTVTLPAALYPVTPDGRSEAVVTTLSLRNGQGALLTNEPVSAAVLSFTARRTAEGAEIEWRVSSTQDHEGFYLHRQDGDQPRVRIVDELFQGQGSYSWLDDTAPSGPVRYWLEDIPTSGASSWHGPAILTSELTPQELPTLSPVRPNPLSTPAQFRFGLPAETHVTLSLHNAAGQRVAVLVDAATPSGSHTVDWAGRNDAGNRAASGVYLLLLETAENVASRKVVVVAR